MNQATDSKSMEPRCGDVVALAREHYVVGCTDAAEPFAVRTNGPNVAIFFNDRQSSFGSMLAYDFEKRFESTPKPAIIAAALSVLHGEALAQRAQSLPQRVAPYKDGILIDRGDPSGEAIFMNSTGWKIEPLSPITFRRASSTAALPSPIPGGDLGELRALLNVTDREWLLLRAWLIGALRPSVGHVLLLLTGFQGVAKSFAAKILRALVDPSTALLPSAPQTRKDWHDTIETSRLLIADNVSSIPPWWSDLLCSAITDGRCPTILTAIDVPHISGDLADRSMRIDLRKIEDYKAEADLEVAFEAMLPGVFGGLLDLLVGVLAQLPNVNVTIESRMADFVEVLAAIDLHDGQDRSVEAYMAQRDILAGNVVEGDLVAPVIVALVEGNGGEWKGTHGCLLNETMPEKPPKDWPRTARAMAARLTRVTPSLEAIGFTVDIPSHRRSYGREITITKNPEMPKTTPSTDTSPPADSADEGSVAQGDTAAEDGGTPEAGPSSSGEPIQVHVTVEKKVEPVRRVYVTVKEKADDGGYEDLNTEPNPHLESGDDAAAAEEAPPEPVPVRTPKTKKKTSKKGKSKKTKSTRKPKANAQAEDPMMRARQDEDIIDPPHQDHPENPALFDQEVA